MRHLTRTTVDAELDGPVSLDGLPGVHDAVLEGTRLRCEVDNAALTEVLRRLSAAGVRTLTCRPPTLEELFLRHYSSEATGGDSAHDRHPVMPRPASRLFTAARYRGGAWPSWRCAGTGSCCRPGSTWS